MKLINVKDIFFRGLSFHFKRSRRRISRLHVQLVQFYEFSINEQAVRTFKRCITQGKGNVTHDNMVAYKNKRFSTCILTGSTFCA